MRVLNFKVELSSIFYRELDSFQDCERCSRVSVAARVCAQAGVHSGDSACSIPPQTIAEDCLAVIREWTPKLARALKVVGLINIQYCIQDNQVCWGACALNPPFIGTTKYCDSRSRCWCREYFGSKTI